MRILSFDPGVTTGIALYDDFDRQPLLVLRTWEHNSQFNLERYWKLLHEHNPDIIVYEKFTPPAATRHRVELFPVQVIGVLRLWVSLRQAGGMGDACLEFSHTASMAKGLWTDEKIKRLGLWVPSQGHGMDALRHLLYHLTITRGDKTWLTKAR